MRVRFIILLLFLFANFYHQAWAISIQQDQVDVSMNIKKSCEESSWRESFTSCLPTLRTCVKVLRTLAITTTVFIFAQCFFYNAEARSSSHSPCNHVLSTNPEGVYKLMSWCKEGCETLARKVCGQCFSLRHVRGIASLGQLIHEQPNISLKDSRAMCHYWSRPVAWFVD
jgi:hypothetical protein